MAEACDISRLACIAAGAGSGLHSLFGAGGCFCLLPCAVAVTKCVGVAVNIAVAACAGVCSITLLGAGWCCHDGGVAVDMCAGGYFDIGDFKAPFVATAIADELYLDRVTIDIDRLSGKLSAGVFADLLALCVVDIEVVEAVLNVGAFIEGRSNFRSAREGVQPNIRAIVAVIVGAFELRNILCDYAVVGNGHGATS